MNEHEKPQIDFMHKLARQIVERRNLVFLFVILAAIFTVFSVRWVKVETDMTTYLPKTSETRMGLDIMDEQFTTYGSADVMVANITPAEADELSDRLTELKGVQMLDYDDTTDHYNKDAVSALYSITFDYPEDDDQCLEALDRVKEYLADYDIYVSTSLGNTQQETIDAEVRVIMVYVAVIIVIVLLLTSQTYAEVPVLILTFVVGMILNMGTNFMLGTISFVSNSVTNILQLALSLDYAIIFCNHFKEEHQTMPLKEAVIESLSKSIPEISSSSLTTVGGLVAMLFMQFRIGFDLGLVLIKAILLSMLAVFTLMPGLLMLFSKAMERTRHKNFIPQIDRWGKLVYALRHVGVPVFIVCVVGGFFLSNQCPYVYGDNAVMTVRRNEHQAATDRVEKEFGTQNIMALVVPKGDTASEKAVLKELSGLDEVDYAMGLSNVEAKPGYFLTDKLTPRQFSEMMGLSYEEACILYAAYTADQEDNYGPIVGGIDSYTVSAMDMILFIYQEKEKGYVTLDDEDEREINDAYTQITDAQAQMLGPNYTRMVMNLNLPEEGTDTFAFLKTVHSIVEKYYDADDVYLVGNSTSDYDQSVSFARDNVMISVLSVVFVVLVLVFTFMSVGLPILLILVIQGSIWINFTFPTVLHTNIFFMSYLIVTLSVTL